MGSDATKQLEANLEKALLEYLSIQTDNSNGDLDNFTFEIMPQVLEAYRSHPSTRNLGENDYRFIHSLICLDSDPFDTALTYLDEASIEEESKASLSNYIESAKEENRNLGFFTWNLAPAKISLIDRHEFQKILDTCIQIDAQEDSALNIIYDLAKSITSIKNFGISMLSQLLFAVKPEHFPILNDPGQKLYNCLSGETGTTYLDNKEFYPENARKLREYIRSRFKFTQFRVVDNAQNLDSKVKVALEALNHEERESPTNNLEDDSAKSESAKHPKNTILYGPPGTGKTYSVANRAYSIAHGVDVNEDHPEAKEWYDTQINEPDGQVAFTTFHQSYSYEDFIEGICPVLSDGESGTGSGLNYCISDGVFKAFCERASAPASAEDLGLNDNPAVWKVSLKGTGDNEVRDDCLKKGRIRIGWDSYGPQVDDQTNFEHGGERVLDAFLNKMSIGDIVVSCYSATATDAIGVITGEAEWHDDYQNYKRQRNVKWLVKDVRFNIVKRFGIPNMTLATIYRLSRLNEGDILTLVSELKDEPSLAEANTKPYIFIIDEINRGNVSSIFGELITLLEPSKRKGASDQQTAILPYSKEKFTVPGNVYVVATMNTADKSLTQIDTALRRRFDFMEMMPDYGLLKDHEIDGVKLDELLEAMNARIAALYDREHEIGHSYLMHLDGSMAKLREAFDKKIIPLLQEYFYDDYSKIRQVLNETDETVGSFIVKDDLFERYARDVGDGETCWKLGDPKDWDADNFKKIYEAPKNSEVDDED